MEDCVSFWSLWKDHDIDFWDKLLDVRSVTIVFFFVFVLIALFCCLKSYRTGVKFSVEKDMSEFL